MKISSAMPRYTRAHKNKTVRLCAIKIFVKSSRYDNKLKCILLLMVRKQVYSLSLGEDEFNGD